MKIIFKVFLFYALLAIVYGCSINSAISCQGEIITSENAGLKFITCWSVDENGKLKNQDGLFEIYHNGKIYMTGQHIDGKATGVWFAYDKSGNIIESCDYSADEGCVITIGKPSKSEKN